MIAVFGKAAVKVLGERIPRGLLRGALIHPLSTYEMKIPIP